MTLLNATVGPDFAVIATDTFVAPNVETGVETAVHLDFEDAERSAFRGDGTRPTIQPIGIATKIQSLPHINAIMGASGAWLPIQRLFGFCCIGGAAWSAESLLAELPEYLRKLSAEHDGPTLSIVAVGMSESGNGVGAAYTSGEKFERYNLPVAHVTTPAPNVEDPDYPRLAEQWQPAALGIDTENFHIELAQNQHRSFAAGKLADGVLLGGELVMARIDADGISLRKACQFPKLKNGDEDV